MKDLQPEEESKPSNVKVPLGPEQLHVDDSFSMWGMSQLMCVRLHRIAADITDSI
jgi:hypothetical protein